METFLSGLLVCVLSVFALGISRANELFALSIRNGRVLYVRGRISPTLLSEIADVIARASVERATVRAVFQQGKVRVIVSGADDLVAQRLRNVVGMIPEHRLRAAEIPKLRNWGQRLGISWLAWLLSDRGK